jgi:hypothetical protein
MEISDKSPVGKALLKAQIALRPVKILDRVKQEEKAQTGHC